MAVDTCHVIIIGCNMLHSVCSSHTLWLKLVKQVHMYSCHYLWYHSVMC